MSTEAIHNYYTNYDEWSRLETPSGRLELIRCLGVLEHHLAPNSTILDLGGGPGRYSVELASRGHRLTLVDLVEEHLYIARDKLDERDLVGQMDHIFEGTACDLFFLDDNSFDAVVAFGPFYHLIDDKDRRQAASEIARVLRPRGKAFVQFLPPMSGFIRLLKRAAEDPPAVSPEALQRAVDESIYQNPTDRGYQEGYYSEPDKMDELFADAGLTPVDMLSVMSIATDHEEELFEIRRRDPNLYEHFLALLEKTSRRPDVISFGKLALWIGRKTPAVDNRSNASSS
jgi:ubiquinone/menaquinone biosynthesis C-methylase UbiE